MKQVWKFILDPKDSTVEMPEGAKPLHVAGQGENICLWAEVDPANKKVKRVFELFGTGHVIGNAFARGYVGTAHIYGDSLVFHVYERFSKVSIA